MAGRYLKKQCQPSMFNLEYHSVSDFYISCWQKNRAVFPLVCVRAIIFLGCLAIVLASASMSGMAMPFGYWFIFLTHWGLVMITVTSGFALAVSCRAYRFGPIEATFELPWFVKVYWVLYNITIPLAFFITVYYYIFLTEMGDDLTIDPVLDVFIHSMNSVLMLVLLVTSRHPARLLHFIHPLGFGIGYLLFTAIYYFAGGVNPFNGNAYIYPTLDWADGWSTALMAALSGVALIIVHLIVVGLTAVRNTLTRRYRRGSESMAVSGIPYK